MQLFSIAKRVLVQFLKCIWEAADIYNNLMKAFKNPPLLPCGCGFRYSNIIHHFLCWKWKYFYKFFLWKPWVCIFVLGVNITCNITICPPWETEHICVTHCDNYWPWDRRCCSCWAGPWTLWGSTPSCWPCSSPDTTFIKLSSVGSEKINHFRITLQFNIDYSRPRVNIYSDHLATALITAASRPRGRLLVALGAGPRVRIPAHCCLISRDPGWYQAWPG